MTPEQERTYDELRGDYGYAEIMALIGTGGWIRVDFYDTPSSGTPSATVTIAPNGDWS